MEYLDENGLQTFLSNLYTSLSVNNNNSSSDVKVDYSVDIDNVFFPGDFKVDSYQSYTNLYIVSSVAKKKED